MQIYGGVLNGGVFQDQVRAVTDNLVEYLDTRDYSGSGSTWTARVGSDATLYNTPAYTNTGPTYFTFTPSSLQYADTPWLGDLSNWTVECWFNLTAALSTTTATAAVTTVYDDGLGTLYNNINYCLGNNSGTPYTDTNIQAGYFNGGWHETAGATPTVGAWYQMVGTFDGSTVSLYVNGTLNNQSAGGGASTANGAPTRIARRWDQDATDATNYFPGSISIVRIYSTALNASQVQQNFTADRGRFGI